MHTQSDGGGTAMKVAWGYAEVRAMLEALDRVSHPYVIYTKPSSQQKTKVILVVITSECQVLGV